MQNNKDLLTKITPPPVRVWPYFVPAFAAALALFGAFIFCTLEMHNRFGISLAWLPQLILSACALIVLPGLLVLRGYRRHSAERAEYEKTLISALVHNTAEGVFDYNLTNNHIFYTSAYKNLLGYEEKEMGTTHKVFDSLIHPDDFAKAYQTVLDYAARKSAHYYNIFRLRHKQGHWVWVLSRGFGLWDGQGRMTRLIGLHVDLTMQKQREEELSALLDRYTRRQEMGTVKSLYLNLIKPAIIWSASRAIDADIAEYGFA